MVVSLRIATFNIRNIRDRYQERKPLLGAAFAAMHADIAGVQEVMYGEHDQDSLLGEASGRTYECLRCPTGREFGNTLLVATGAVMTHETLELGARRWAQRALLTLPGQRTLWVANTHLHHRPLEPEVRAEQVRALLAWMADAPAADAAIIMGDFNASPAEQAYSLMAGAGYRSAFLEANGREPAVTWPSGIQAEGMDTDGDPACLDYVWVSGRITVTGAALAANEHAPGDPTLYPSDHFAIVADLELA